MCCRPPAPFFVAELSGNHNKSLDTAIQLVRAAKDAGANAVKLQTYTPDCLTMESDRPEFLISDPNSLWHGRRLYDLYKDAMMPWEFHAPIFLECRKLGLIGFSTPFSERGVEFLETLEAPMYKIASFEINHLPLLKRVIATRKPMLVSTGVAAESDIRELLYQAHNVDVTLLKCTSEYPAKLEDADLQVMARYGKRYGCAYGLSDHSLTNVLPMVATALGASVIEKHIKLNDSDEGVDSKFSITVQQFKEMVEACKQVTASLGKDLEIKANPQPPSGSRFRRSLYIVKDVKKGEVFTSKNIRVIRPNLGCAPFAYDIFLGKTAKEDYTAGTPTHYGMINA